jgi:hypothetical protein
MITNSNQASFAGLYPIRNIEIQMSNFENKKAETFLTLPLKLTLRLPGINAGACLRPELRPRGSGLTLSGALLTALKGGA